MKNLLLLGAFLFSFQVFTQEITGEELLNKSIQYHDPYGNWSKFVGGFLVQMKTPNKPHRNSEIFIDLPKQLFSVKATTGKTTTGYYIVKDSVQMLVNGNKNPSIEVIKKHKLSKERAKMYQNYYTYLYGLPMKLKDPGTLIHNKVIRKKFKGKTYLVLKVTYQKEVGNDTWYFYFDPKTYAMEVYQFFHDQSKNDGEYILLSEEVQIQGIKMPKQRAWYFNKKDTYLGTDVLLKQ